LAEAVDRAPAEAPKDYRVTDWLDDVSAALGLPGVGTRLAKAELALAIMATIQKPWLTRTGQEFQ
jgi:hypothetical protein